MLSKALKCNLHTLVTLTKHPARVVVWICCSIAAYFLLWLIWIFSNDLQTFSQNYGITEGIYLRYNGDHGKFYYEYSLSGRRYTGYDSTDEKELSEIIHGTQFHVYYSTIDQNYSSLVEPKRLLASAKSLVSWVGSVISLITLIIIAKLSTLVDETAT